MTQHPVLDPANQLRAIEQRCALGIMTKVPEAGRVKTRLTPPLTPDEAAELNRCFLRDLGASIVQASQRAPARGVGIYTPLGAEAAYEDILPPEFLLIPQRGDAFGERLVLATEDLFGVGFGSVCLINSDSPTVPASSFTEAAKVLSEPGDRVVLGPSDDGGYYLIGLKKLHRRLFEEIDWSTERVLAQTLRRSEELGLQTHLLSPGFDVDDGATLRRLCEELTGAGDSAPNTRQFLNAIIAREGRGRIWPL